jgi:hypothetical protein
MPISTGISIIVQGEIVSSWAEIYSGVPQGSVIGPFLFVIYINNLTGLFKNISKLYADDTKIISKNTTDICGMSLFLII